MLRNYLKIGLRNIFKQKSTTLINVLGLTIGMTCFILIAKYIQYEFSYDTHHENADQIYRVAQTQAGNEFRGTDKFALAPMPLAPAMVEQFPEVETATTLQITESLFSHEEQVFYEKGLFADEHIFDVFSYPVLEGIGKEALTDPNAIVVSENMAKKYFGETSPIGKTLLVNSENELTVRGVLKNIPKNQHLVFDYIIPLINYPHYEDDQGRWGSNNYRAYFFLQNGADYKEVEKKMAMFDEQVKAAYHNAPFHAEYFFQPLKDIHLYSNINFEASANGDIRYIYLSASIAFIILLLALINYMNLATVRSPKRLKEVGMRKMLGAKKVQLVVQFMMESVLITLFSFVIATALSDILLPAFNQLIGQQIPSDFVDSGMLFFAMIAIALLLGGLSGLYPAVLSSVVSPVKALKGNLFKNKKDGTFLRNAMVVGQFAAAVVLAIGSIVVYQQLEFIQNKKLGYNRDQVLYVPYQRQAVFEKMPTLRNELLKHPNIEKVTIPTYLPLNMISQGVEDKWEGNATKEELYIYRSYVDHHFFDLFEIELIEGRNFSPEFSTDSTSSFILNESAVKKLGWENPIGKEFAWGKVIGVVKDFHFQPFDLNIEPMYFTFVNKWTLFDQGHIAMKINMDDYESTLAHVQKTVKTIVPNLPFEHHFMDDSFNQLYESEKRFGKAFGVFTFLALFIACIGLFGLVAHQVAQRTKEIGIRKVLGATTAGLVGLLSKDFIKLVFISLVVASPVAYYFMENWLQDFAYRINISWWVFVAAGMFAIGVAFMTVGFQSAKAALANPVESLRSE